MSKTFVKATAGHDERGQIRPLLDGRKFEIDRILDVRQAPLLKAVGVLLILR